MHNAPASSHIIHAGTEHACHAIQLSLFMGGTRSGKSILAEQLALQHSEYYKGQVLYVATATPCDASMRERISRHQQRRPASWNTLEQPLDLATHIAQYCALPPLQSQQAETSTSAATVPDAKQLVYASPFHEQPQCPSVILIDCVTLWVTNILFSLPEDSPLHLFETTIQNEISNLLKLMQYLPAHWILVSGETGLGGIGASRIERHFNDGLGLANQLLAEHASSAYFCIAGRVLPLQEFSFATI